MHTNGFKMIHLSTRPYLFEDMILLIVTILRNKKRYRLSHRFRFGIPEYLFSSFIPAQNNPVQVLTDDGIVGRFYNSRKDGLFFISPQTLTYVPGHFRGPNNYTFIILDWRDGQG